MNQRTHFVVRSVLAFFLLHIVPSAVLAQTASVESPGGIYQATRAFDLAGGGSARVSNLKISRDRADITFTGVFYFAAPVAGRVTGAVFVGQGTFRAEVPPSRFEQENIRRMLKTDVIESDFANAVLRFSDDTYDLIKKGDDAGSATPEAVKLASDFEGRFLKETGANAAARLALSIVNKETPGFFLAQFDKGRRGRFNLLLDHQSRIPVANFRINGGEKGLIFTYNADYLMTEVWMAFYSLGDYVRRTVTYSDAFDVAEVSHYAMDVDLRDPGKSLAMTVRVDFKLLAAGVRAVPFKLSESLSAYHDDRLKLAMRLKSAKLVDGPAVEFVQEDWEGGFMLLLPRAYQKGEAANVDLVLDGNFMQDVANTSGNYYPRSNETWYPRHGYLQRSTFDLTFHHKKNVKVASIGVFGGEAPSGDGKEMTTRFATTIPVSLATFAIGPFERHAEKTDGKDGPAIDVEFYTMPTGVFRIQHGFIIAEMINSINYFSKLFGNYPFPVFRGVVHPYGFGQGMPMTLMLPPADRADKETYSFIAHETSHQWWGHVVMWRSYRDQWLSEGFAEYSGLMFTGRRDRMESEMELLKGLRDSLRNPPRTALGFGSGRLTDVGPIIMGHRLMTRETTNAYTTLIYNKGGLVLRMLHFLLTDPANGNDQAFLDMMTDFVKRFQGRSASTDDFLQVASEHFVGTPIAQKFGATDLSWFFKQWVYQTYLPSYRLEYSLEPQPDNSVILKGTVFQEGIPADDKWFMPLPVVISFDKDKKARTVLAALGPETPFSLKLPSKPQTVELDPDLWVLSDKTTTKAVK